MSLIGFIKRITGNTPKQPQQPQFSEQEAAQVAKKAGEELALKILHDNKSLIITTASKAADAAEPVIVQQVTKKLADGGYYVADPVVAIIVGAVLDQYIIELDKSIK